MSARSKGSIRRLNTFGARRQVNGLDHTSNPPGFRCSQNTIFQSPFAVVIEVIEIVACGFLRLAGEVRQLVVSVEMHLDGLASEIGTLDQAILDVGVASGGNQRREP